MCQQICQSAEHRPETGFRVRGSLTAVIVFVADEEKPLRLVKGQCAFYSLPNPRHEHRHTSLILLVGAPMSSLQVPFLQMDGDDDVECRHPSEQEVPPCHDRCGPKSDDKAEHDGVSNNSIESSHTKWWRRIRRVHCIKDNLTQAEEIEVIDEESGDQCDDPACTEQSPQDDHGHRLLNFPGGSQHRTPLPKQKHEHQT